eukprot:1689322-Alexandrium_andersonii.AAC.1
MVSQNRGESHRQKSLKSGANAENAVLGAHAAPASVLGGAWAGEKLARVSPGRQCRAKNRIGGALAARARAWALDAHSAAISFVLSVTERSKVT